MTIDYYISLGSAITGILTDSPLLKAVPTAFRLTATCFPRLFPLGMTKRFNTEEKAKLGRIQGLLKGICQDLGIKDSSRINLRVSRQLGANACMIGTINSWGGPVLCLGDTYFKNYESLLNTDNSEFRKWLALLDEIPNTPAELGRYMDGCSIEKRNQIQRLSRKFKDVLSQDELESMLAHELGHAKHYHLLKISGLLLLTLAADKAAQVFAKKIGFHTVYTFLSLPLIYIAIQAIARGCESEADGECAVTAKYQRGMLEFHKKQLISELFKKTFFSFEKKVDQMIKASDWRSSHPNAAKRLQHAVQLTQKQNHPSTKMTKVAWALTGLGVLSLIQDCVLNAVQIWDAI